MNDEKGKIRAKLLEMRRGLSSKDIEEASAAIFQSMLQLDVVKDAEHILIYSNFDNEVKTAEMTGWLLYQKKNVYLPLVEGREMFAADIKTTLELSDFGVAQPKWENAKIISPEKLDLIIVPGVAFDKQKNRIGFGMGYYDAFLAKTKAYRLALAYDFQMLDSIPAQPHDQKMDSIMTQEQQWV